MTERDAPPQSAPQIRSVTQADIFAALSEGWADFRAAPTYGVFFSAFYVCAGLLIWLQLALIGQSWWMLPLALGFPILGPFAAVGLYEVSRRLETGETLDWPGVLGVVTQQRGRQTPYLAAFILFVFLVWLFIAHMIFALFFGLKVMTNVSASLDIYWSINGLMMLVVGGAVGAALSLLLYSTTVIGLPLLMDREIDVVTATIRSVGAVRANPGPMLIWGAIVGAALLIAMIPYFLGLFIALPVLGHATWRLYRRIVSFPD